MTFRQNPVLFVLIGLNIAIFLAQQAGWDMRDIGALWLPFSPHYQYWQWVSHMFLHEDLLHILFNMYALGMFGVPLLRVWGGKRFVLLYVLGGLLAAAVYVGWQLFLLFQAAQTAQYDVTARNQAFELLFTPMIGASGAVFAVLAAFAMRLPHARLGLLFIPISLPARMFVGLIIGYELFAQFSGISLFGDNIAHLAHVGGALAGLLLGMLFMRQEKRVLQNMLPEHHDVLD